VTSNLFPCRRDPFFPPQRRKPRTAALSSLAPLFTKFFTHGKIFFFVIGIDDPQRPLPLSRIFLMPVRHPITGLLVSKQGVFSPNQEKGPFLIVLFSFSLVAFSPRGKSLVLSTNLLFYFFVVVVFSPLGRQYVSPFFPSGG